MAYVKILSIKSAHHCKQAIRYIESEEKTNEQAYVSVYACDPSTASAEFAITRAIAEQCGSGKRKRTGNSIEAYHVIQSFAPGEVTPEVAHEIGKRLAGELLDGKHEFVIATHIDKGHIHNHILFNSVLFYDYKKFRTAPYKTIAQLRDISNRLSIEHDLSVIEPRALGCNYKEWQERNKNTSWKADIRKQLNFITARTTSYEEFKEYCVALHLFFDDSGKQNRFRLVGQERNVREDTLDKSGRYSTAGIKQRCEKNRERRDKLKETLRVLIPQYQTYEELVDALKERDIECKETYHGLRWTIGEDRFTEYELGTGFSLLDLKEAIEQQCYEPQLHQRDIFAEWTDKESRQKGTSKKDVSVAIPQSCVQKIADSGLLIAVPPTGEMLFLSNHLLEFDEAAKQYTLYLNPKVPYSLAPEKLNPDIRISDQSSQKSIRGETLLRQLELANGVKPSVVNVQNAAIRSIGEKV